MLNSASASVLSDNILDLNISSVSEDGMLGGKAFQSMMVSGTNVCAYFYYTVVVVQVGSCRYALDLCVYFRTLPVLPVFFILAA